MNLKYILIFCSIVSCVVQADTNWSTWMQDNMNYIENRTFYEIMIPGTHDAGAYSLSSTMVPNGEEEMSKWVNIAAQLHIDVTTLVRNWSISQQGNLYFQFTKGIRHIDFRALWNEGEWYTHHGLIGSTVDSMIDDIIRFMNETKGECIIIEVGHTDYSQSGYDNMNLVQKFEDRLNAWLISHDTNLSELTFGQMMKTNKRIILNFDLSYVASQSKYFYYVSDMLSGYYANSDDIHTMNSHNQNLIDNKDTSRILELSWTLTPQTKTILDGILAWNPHTLLDLSVKGNKWFNDFYQFNKSKFAGVIVACDNFETGSFTSSVIDFVQSLPPKYI